MDLFVRAVHACPTVLTVLILLWLNEGFQKLRDRALLFVRAVHACPTVLTVLILLWLNEGFQKLRDRALLFYPLGGEGGRGFWGDHLFFRRTKGKRRDQL